MEKLVNENFIREITPLSDKDCFYIADRLNLFITGILGSYPLYDGLAFWVTALFSTFQLYADFYRQAKYTFNAERLESYEQIGESVKKLKLLLDK